MIAIAEIADSRTLYLMSFVITDFYFVSQQVLHANVRLVSCFPPSKKQKQIEGQCILYALLRYIIQCVPRFRCP